MKNESKAQQEDHDPLLLKETIAALTKKNRELMNLVARDELTGLYNRRKLKAVLDREVSRAGRYNRPLSAILLDIDHFKAVNDTHGHAVGDTVLIETASLLQSTLRACDISGRWGGDEFLIICPEAAPDSAMQLAERLRKEFERRTFPATVRLTASFGVAGYRNGSLAGDILKDADDALYCAKNEGRNRVSKKVP